MVGRCRIAGTPQVRPCRLGRGIHAADTPQSDTAPPLTDLRDLVDPRHAWMNLFQISKSIWGQIRFPTENGSDPKSHSERSQKSVEGGVGPVAGAGAPWMARPSLHGRTCSVPRNRTHPAYPQETRFCFGCCCCFGCCSGLCGCRAQPCRPTPYLAAAICFSMSAAVTGPRKLCASLPCGSIRWVSGRPRGVAKSAGGSNGSTITIG